MTSEKKDLTLWDLEQRLYRELKENRHEVLADTDEGHDMRSEIIDSCIPIMTYDALTCACDKLWLAVDEPEMEAKNAFECIIYNIDYHLPEKADEWIERERNK